MQRIHIVGWKNQGKTTLLVELIAAATRRGLRVGAIKHTHHPHEVDKPGTDSYRMRGAGAAPAAFVTGPWMGIFMPCEPGACYDRLEELYADCDLVLVEGDANGDGTKVEVWRADLGRVPMALRRDDITAVITGDLLEVDVPVWSRSDPERILDQLLALSRPAWPPRKVALR